MKRACTILILFTSLILSKPCRGQTQDNENSASSIATQQDSEERYQRLNSEIEDLLRAQAVIQKRLTDLTFQLSALQNQSSQPDTNVVTQDQLQALVAKVREIDKQRQADRKLILEQLDKLAQKLASQPEPPPASDGSGSSRKHRSSSAPVYTHGYNYTIQSGDTLSAIATAFRKKGVKVTVQDILDADPGLNPKKLRVGQTIFVPDPSIK